MQLKHEESRNYYIETKRSSTSLLIVIVFLAGRHFCDIIRAKISLVVNFFNGNVFYEGWSVDR